MARSTFPSVVALLFMSGCYASHRPGSEGDDHCVSPEPSVGNPCGALSSTSPLGVCALDDGSLIAFTDSEHAASCTASETDGFLTLESHHCTSERPTRREVVRCGSAAPEVHFHVFRRPPFTRDRFDLSGASCAIADFRMPAAAEPWRPFVEAEELCSDPYAWCGSPIVLELRQPDGDPCNGDTYTERCTATIAAGRIVLRAETARSVASACAPALGDRVATCVVPPLSAGRYDVIDGEGRALGAIDVPGVQPIGDLETTCTALPD